MTLLPSLCAFSATKTVLCRPCSGAVLSVLQKRRLCYLCSGAPTLPPAAKLSGAIPWLTKNIYLLELPKI